MRNNNTEGRRPARGGARKSPMGRSSFGSNGPRRNEGGRSFGSKRYSAGEGSVEGSADSSAKRSFGSRDAGAPRRFNNGERSERPRRFNDGEKRDFKPRRFNDGERKPYNNAEKFGGKRFAPKPRYTDQEGNEVEYKRPQAQSYTPKPRQPRINGEEGVRLNKFIANSGICSRREADDYITAGLVSVNDVIITELGTRVFKNDVVKFNNERIKGEEKVYIVMNKPKDFVTTMSDPYAERTIMQLIEGKCKERVFPVGRLDKATTGVILITNDGDLADKLTHPSYEKKKIYHVYLDKNFKTGDFDILLNGVELEDGTIKADGLSYIDEDKAQIGVEIHSGRNRIVRRMFEHLGYKIKKLDRVYFAGLTKKNLRRGQWRFLDDQEVAMLKMGSYE